MLHEITIDDLEEELSDWFFAVTDRGDVLKVETDHGKAVVISEEEWLTLRDGFFEKLKNAKERPSDGSQTEGV